MILPASYANGFAPRDGQPLYPELWKSCVFAAAPCLGPTGSVLRDWSGFGGNGDINNATLSTAWGPKSLTLDGVNDFVSADSLVTRCANHTQGAICFWANLTSDNNSQNAAFAISRDALGTQSYILIDFDMRSADNFVNVLIVKDGAVQWRYNTPTGSIVAGRWIHVAVVQNGVAPVIYLNGQSQTLAPVTTTDTTAWLKAILTDATSKADTANIGMLEFNGSDLIPFPGAVDDMRIYDAANNFNIAALLASRRGIAHELAPIRHAGETAASYRRRLQAAQLVGGGIIAS